MTKILIIDDDIDMADVLKMVLINAGFDVVTTSSSLDAVDLTRNEKPDLILLDVLMPEMDGWEVCKAIRKFSKVPIIILSVFKSPQYLQQALDAGADGYLAKPVSRSELIAHINGLVRRSRVEVKAHAVSAET